VAVAVGVAVTVGVAVAVALGVAVGLGVTHGGVASGTRATWIPFKTGPP
jgi:hypothetical protein